MDDAQERREVDDLLRVTWPQLYCLEGDTMVFLDYPSFGARNCQDIPWSSARFRMDSQKLLATGSSEITRLLSEDKQRRLRLQHRSEKLPSDIRYILDLTPETEGDHIASLLGSLSLPRGVRDWWMAKDRFGVSQWFVSGHDDWCHNHADIPLDCKKPDSVTLPLVRSAIEDARKYKILLGPEVIADCPVREIAEYCEIRHRANIVRLLLAVAGYDLVLNSAPRVYAIVMLAEDLDLVNVIVGYSPAV